MESKRNDVLIDVPLTGKLQSLSKLQGDDWGKAQILEFKNLTYQVEKVKSVDGKKERYKADILKNIYGKVVTGELMAIIGPSGAGKSTFLDAIAGRIRPESLKGTLTLNGQPSHTRIKKVSAYVQQDDELFPMMTVEETFMFSAGVRLPPSISIQEKRARVKQLISQLGLESAAGTIVGNSEVRGISGGERRRVSIGVDIIHDPSILFLDEPTSGLDSSAAFSVIERMKIIAQSGSLVVCTIHQPSFRVLDLFDKLLVLVKGQIAFLGPPKTLPQRLLDAGVEVPQFANSAEVVMDVLQPQADSGGLSNESQKLIELHDEEWSGKATAVAPISDNFAGKMSVEPTYTNNFFTELGWIMWRSAINIRRSPPLFIVRIVNVIVTSFLLASLFWRPNVGVQGASNYVSFIVFAICLVYFTSNDALAVFIEERLIFIRESSHYAYRTSSYVIGNMLVFMPFLLLLAVIFTTLCWWTVDLAGGASGFFFWILVLFCSFFTANSFVSFLSAIVPNLVVGNTIALAVTAYYLLLSGFFIKTSEIPAYWLWIHYLSSLKWPYNALVLEQFDRNSCYQTASQPGDWKISGNSTGNSACILSGKDVVSSLDVGDVNKWICCLILVGLALAYRVAFYLALRISSTSKRK